MSLCSFPLPLGTSRHHLKSHKELRNMGVSTRENGVLKLVRPGRHVEIYREPITAAEIMKKYPRHCIARPDVFKFPWIVVRPESVLQLGKVFYLIPNHTLYNLLKTKGKRGQPASREKQFWRNHDHHHSRTGQKSPIKCWGGITSKHCKHHQHDGNHRRRLPNMLFQDRTNSHDQDSEGYGSDTSYVDAWAQITDKIRKLELTSYQASPLDSSFDSRENFHPRRHRNSATNVATSTLAIVTHRCTHVRSSEAHTRLKSCFRKQESVRKLLNLKVTFGPPIVIPGSPPVPASLE